MPASILVKRIIAHIRSLCNEGDAALTARCMRTGAVPIHCTGLGLEHAGLGRGQGVGECGPGVRNATTIVATVEVCGSLWNGLSVFARPTCPCPHNAAQGRRFPPSPVRGWHDSPKALPHSAFTLARENMISLFSYSPCRPLSRQGAQLVHELPIDMLAEPWLG